MSEIFKNFLIFLKNSGNISVLRQNKNHAFLRAIRGSRKEYKIPLNLSDNLAYFVGAITGDGYVSSANYRIGIHKANEKYLREVFIPLVHDLFSLNLEVKDGKRSFHVYVKNKAMWLMLKEVFDMPKGKKAAIVSVPRTVKEANSKIQKAYLAGLFDTDGGRRGNGFGLTTASVKMFKESIILLKKLGFCPLTDSWTNHKYQRKYYGWRIAKKEEAEFFQQIPLKNRKKFGEYAGIPKRSKGYVLDS